MPIIAFYLIAALAFTGVGGAVGYRIADRIGDLNLKQCEQANLKRINSANAQARAELALAYQAADQAILKATEQEKIAKAQSEELKHAIKAHTNNRNCLSNRARGVLHTAAAFNRAPLPKDTYSAIDANAAAAANSSDRGGQLTTAMTTDTDAAQWIMDAAAAYQTCRARIAAITEWNDREGTR